jgi:sRNA-binding carbon storage regulator CsrA
MLHLSVAVGDTLSLDDGRIQLTVVQKKGQQVRFAIVAPRTVSVAIMNETSRVRARGLSLPRKQ